MTSFSKILTTAVAAACMVGAVQPAAAKITEAQAARLGADLTPVGAEKAGNKDGTIPAWEGGLTAPPAGWTPAQGYVDPFASDKPLFTITPANADQYKDKLSAGEYAMLKKYPTFQIPVYQTRRTAAYPKQVTDTVKAQATKVELQGFGIKDVGLSTVPFPIPATGMEAIWNHLLRYLGGGLDRTYNSLPVRASGDYYKVGFREYRIFNQNFDQPKDNGLLMFLGYFTAPATLEGTVFLVHEPMDQVKEPRSAWIYNAGQRRVRRAPDLTYDNVNDGTEGIRTTDQYDAYNGAPDRYDWKLVGKKEIYVPYNAYKLVDKKLKYADMAKPKHLRPDLIRHELHRVWVVEARLKAGSKHVYGRRTFYLDEDSWSVLIEDAYDTRGQLWRVSINPLIQYYDAGVPWYAANIYHDLNNGSYLAGALQNEIKTPWVFGVKGKIADFQPDALRRAGTK